MHTGAGSSVLGHRTWWGSVGFRWTCLGQRALVERRRGRRFVIRAAVASTAVSSLGVLALVGAIVAWRGSDDSGGSSGTSRVAIGVYRGAGPWGAARIGAYERWLGRPVDVALDFQDVDTWSNQEWPDWQARAWQRAKRTVMLGGIGVFPVGGTWQAAARGDDDDHWRRAGERLVATGQAGALLRGAHEFNGSWFHYGVTSRQVDDFVTAWRRWVDVMRQVPGQHFTFVWNPTVGTERLRHPDDAYPGDEWVDVIGIDVYDGWYAHGWVPGVDAPPDESAQDRVWSRLLDGERGLRWWHEFARERGKPMAFPEWGLRTWLEPDGTCHGGGDDPRFVQRMHELITDPSWSVRVQAFWEHAGHGIADSDQDPARSVPVPASRRTFVELDWGPGPTAPTERTTSR